MAIKARSNHRAMIEDQFVILSQMTEEIKYNFDKRIDKIEQIAKEDAISQSDGDDIIFHSVLNNNSYQTEIQKSYDMIIQARQIVFCAIYSYYETMLNRIIIQYSLPAQKNEKKDAKEKTIRTNPLWHPKTVKPATIKTAPTKTQMVSILATP